MSGKPNRSPVLSEIRRCSNRPNSFRSPLWLSMSWKNFRAAFAPQIVSWTVCDRAYGRETVVIDFLHPPSYRATKEIGSPEPA